MLSHVHLLLVNFILLKTVKQEKLKFKEANGREFGLHLKSTNFFFIEGRRWYQNSEQYCPPNKTKSPKVDNPSKKPIHHDQQPRELRDHRTQGYQGTNATGKRTNVKIITQLYVFLFFLLNADDMVFLADNRQ